MTDLKVNMAKKDDSDLLEERKTDYIAERNRLLRDIPYETVKRAWFILSHLLLEDGAKVIDMGCGSGEVTFAMAILRPELNFVGVDRSRQTVEEAKRDFQSNNLEFMVGDVSSDLFDPESVDAIINSFMLHQVFSNARYNEQIISDTLRKQFRMLKEGGTMFIRDYAKPDDDDHVLLEMHDEKSTGKDLSDYSEVDLLIWYSEHARPKQDPGCGGFFLEELEPRFPKTKLFRLPHKWAYEFIMRKDKRKIWKRDLPFEYTFYTIEEFRKELRALGARVQYSGPHWDDDHIAKHFDGHFRLLKLNGDPLGDPPTSFIAVAQKQPERSSLNVEERRITHDDAQELEIKTLRDQKEGTLLDVVTRNKEFAEILPYRVDEKNRLFIYLHDGVIRSIANAVSRSGINIDGREWSGHMAEAISIDYEKITGLGGLKGSYVENFSKQHLGLECSKDVTIDTGPLYYPDPNYIDERIHTFYLAVSDDNDKTLSPKGPVLKPQRFQAKGVIREINAQQVLDAIAVGLIPNSRLELQILSLMQFLKVKAENWISKDISVAAGEITSNFEVREFMRQAANNEKRFKEAKGSAGQLRTLNSVFVEEGQSQGGRTGISSDNVDFVLSEQNTVNTAVVLPLTKSMKGDLHAGFHVKHMPVPQRFEGKSLSISAPQFNIPKEITTYKMMRQFIAEKFGVTPDMVMKLGESYFSHIGITPQRIHPFAIIAPPDTFKDPNTKFMPVYQYMLLWKSISREQHFMTIIARAYRYIPSHMKTQAQLDIKPILEKIFKAAQPDWSMPDAVPVTTPKKAFEASNDPKGKDEKKKKNDKSPVSKVKETKDKENERSDKKTKEAKKTSKPVDINLIEDFEHEIQAIRDALDAELEEEPKPEKW